MGRVKLKIKKLENTSGRQVTYSKRSLRILKKAKDYRHCATLTFFYSCSHQQKERPTFCLGECRFVYL
ncbi:Floral homeotic protein GLOBOSA [Apostasia shenzhenica]|uniref:Floral homeotic protein GLOBOSA n=1 Tax=Apostasia shenzhenica TaxID=1088818 RepID=A0A2I0AFB1_9ASPA|nr:Floral homeotic protein GLOBOSA [Apostasia shenzhenica]